MEPERLPLPPYLTIEDAANTRKGKDELIEWMGVRAAAGRLVPKGFPRNGKFS